MKPNYTFLICFTFNCTIGHQQIHIESAKAFSITQIHFPATSNTCPPLQEKQQIQTRTSAKGRKINHLRCIRHKQKYRICKKKKMRNENFKKSVDSIISVPSGVFCHPLNTLWHYDFDKDISLAQLIQELWSLAWSLLDQKSSIVVQYFSRQSTWKNFLHSCKYTTLKYTLGAHHEKKKYDSNISQSFEYVLG